jgi:Predicted redox protein, regulator of disulfide bond formation
VTATRTNEFDVTFALRSRTCGKQRTEFELAEIHSGKADEVFHMATDESRSPAGENSAPPPLAHFATALVGCLVTHIRAFARAMDIPLRDVSAEATFRWIGRRIGDATHEARLDAISIDIDIDSVAAEGDLLRLVDLAKKGSFVEQTLSQSINLSHRLKRPGGWTSL